MPNNFDVKHKKHFKLYVQLKDKITFESELEKYNIHYYTNINEQPFIDGGIRYFLLDVDREKIDQILIKNEILASTETIPNNDYKDDYKIIKLSLLILLALFVVGSLIILLLK